MHHDALHGVVYTGSVVIIECLLDGGAVASELGSNGSCALSRAATKDNIDVMKLLLQRGAPVDQRDVWGEGVTPLGYATICGCIQAMQLLLDNGADINTRDCTGKSPFLVAVKKQWK